MCLEGVPFHEGSDCETDAYTDESSGHGPPQKKVRELEGPPGGEGSHVGGSAVQTDANANELFSDGDDEHPCKKLRRNMAVIHSYGRLTCA